MVYCNHENENDRCITGTWSIDELRVAFEKGYRLIDTTEVWIYETEQGDPQDMNKENRMAYDELVENLRQNRRELGTTNGFFTSYTNTFIRLKAESAGYPENCETEAQKEEYILNFYRENNILLRKHKIKKNEALYKVIKSLLNGLFGKLAQKPVNSFTTIIHDIDELNFYLNSDLHEINDVYCCNDNYIVLNWQMKRDDLDNEVETTPGFARQAEKNVSITTGIQTTTNARLRLYSELDKLGDRCFYMDTDSIIFLQRNENEYCPKLENKVGGFTDELVKFRKPGSNFTSYIQEFVSLGPKSYSLKIVSEPLDSPTFEYKYETKCKGITLTGENAKRINFDLMKSFVLGKNYTDQSDDIIMNDFVTEQDRIRTLKNFRLVTRKEQKVLRFTFDKRIIDEDLRTYPFGYKQ